MVALEALLTQAEQEAKLDRTLWHMGLADEEILRGLIEKHASLTGSARARLILDNWELARTNFVKVFPNEYRRALSEMASKGRKLAA
jgi:glutamate synthase domain-containing protein 3